jgi:hypothetical protein
MCNRFRLHMLPFQKVCSYKLQIHSGTLLCYTGTLECKVGKRVLLKALTVGICE